MWRRLGRLELDTSRASSWAATHAALPVTELVSEGVWNLYLSLRDGEGRARIGRTQLTLDPRPIVAPLDPDPVLDLGALGAFDDSGVVTSCLVNVEDRRYLFYTGWCRGVTVPFYLAAGLAVSKHEGPFRRVSRAPLLGRTDVDPFLTASPFVMIEGPRWRMWYVSGSHWSESRLGPRHHYNIRYAESDDGLVWNRAGVVCLDYGEPNEYAFGRPWVIRQGGTYKMWYAVRGDRYRIGYAESSDAIVWVRLDHVAGFGPGDSGWDSEMVEYPCVLEYKGQRYMLYNGNGYGKTGIGIAVWEVVRDS